MSNPDTIDVGKFKSYEARRTLDRMIGYEISPKVRDLGGAFISQVEFKDHNKAYC